MIFIRDPAGDYQFPCDQHYPYSIYGYRCFDSFMPYTMFPDINPQMWSEITRYLDCKLYPEENKSSNGIGIRTTVMSYLQLDCTNDSTVCFRPTADEQMEFVFRFGPEIGLTDDDDIRFRIEDKDGNRVYEKQIFIPYMDPFTNPFGFPPFSMADTMRLFWDGRINFGLNDGHLADPALDSYRAIVQVLDSHGNPRMETNVESFDLVPTIDSVLVTHTPWYPPPDGGHIYIISIIRGKVDDSDDPQVDYRYFIPNGETYPGNLYFWDGHSYMFHDLIPVQFYENLNSPLHVVNWDNEHWGDISYNRYHVHDYGFIDENDYSHIAYENHDTTAWWGSNWKTMISNNVDWKSYDSHPHMRLLIRSEVSNKKAGYDINSFLSPGKWDAHKVVMSNHWFIYYYDDINYWAISQIGVPYYLRGSDPRGGKVPYLQMDCSGLITAGRIQEIGSDNNENYRLGSINVAAYVNHGYRYPDVNGQWYSTETLDIEPSESARGDLLVLANIIYDNNWSHITLLDRIDVDIETGYIYHGYIIHAKGDKIRSRRRVKYDNLLFVYRPYINGGIFGGGTWFYKFLRFEPQ